MLHKISKKEVGLSLVEVLIAVVILSVGILGVVRPMIASAGVIRYLENRTVVDRLMYQKKWELEDEISSKGEVFRLDRYETVTLRDRIFNYRIKTKPRNSSATLQLATMSLDWTEGGIKKTMHRDFYVLFPPQDEKQKGFFAD